MKTLITVGWREWVHLPDLDGQWLKAKIDTGARSSSLHAFDLESFERDGDTWVRFSMHPGHEGAPVEAPLIDTRSVKSSTGVAEPRPVIRTRLVMGTVEREVEVTLTRRDEMGFRMLVGRQALRGAFAVSPGRSFLTGTPDAEPGRAPFAIGGASIAAGTQLQVELPIAQLASGSHVALPILVLHGHEDGPTVWIDAAIRGDEVGGVEVVRRVLEHLDPTALRGTLIVVPVLNVHGFATGDRDLPDGRDLSRSFPGSARGSLARRIAHGMLAEVVSRCAVGIDLRTGTEGHTCLPQIRANLADPTTLGLARSFGAPVLLHAKPRDGSLRSAATQAGAAVLVFEGGEARRHDLAAIEAAEQGVLRVMAELSMIDPVAAAAPSTTRAGRTRWVRANRSGLAQLDCQLGQVVAKGEVVGRIHDSFGRRLSRCKSPIAGLVIGCKHEPLVNRGDPLIQIASITNAEAS